MPTPPGCQAGSEHAVDGQEVLAGVEPRIRARDPLDAGCGLTFDEWVGRCSVVETEVADRVDAIAGFEAIEALLGDPGAGGFTLGIEAVGEVDGSADDREREIALGESERDRFAVVDREIDRHAVVEHDLLRCGGPAAGPHRRMVDIDVSRVERGHLDRYGLVGQGKFDPVHRFERT